MVVVTDWSLRAASGSAAANFSALISAPPNWFVSFGTFHGLGRSGIPALRKSSRYFCFNGSRNGQHNSVWIECEPAFRNSATKALAFSRRPTLALLGRALRRQ